MHTKCEYLSASRSLDDELIVSFIVNDNVLSELEKLKGAELVMDIDKYRQKRSLNANAYFWRLCQQLADALRSDKDSVYIWLIGRYGEWTDLYVVDEAIPMLRRQFRYVESMGDGVVRCYFGSSTYDTKQMSRLINGAVDEAHAIGISTWDEEEIERLIKAWKGE